MSDLTDRRLDLFAFASAPLRHTYLAILNAFDDARERSSQQLAPADVALAVDSLDSTDAAQSALDSLHNWGVLHRLQDDAHVRTVAEYRQRRSVYSMTEIGWLAYKAVQEVVNAIPGEAEVQRLILEKVHSELKLLIEAVRNEDAERTALHLGQIHRMLDDLSHQATRFLIATSELSTTWEIDPASFGQHKRRLIGHLDGFLSMLLSHRPRIAAELAHLVPLRERLISLATASSAAEPHVAKKRAEQHVDGIVQWFDDSTGGRSKATSLVERTTRAIRDLTDLLQRVIDATSGGVSRARRLEELAGWFIACPDDSVAHALASVTSGLRGVQHIGVVHADPSIEPSVSWWDAEPATVDTTLRKHGKSSPITPPKPIPDRRQANEVLRWRQLERRRQEAEAQKRLAVAVNMQTPLDPNERAVLLRLLSRTLHSRGPKDGKATSVYGRLRMTLEKASVDTTVKTTDGLLILPGVSLTLTRSNEGPRP